MRCRAPAAVAQRALAAALVLFAGCAAAPPDEALAERFTARGNEPGWLLTLDGRRMTLQWNYGDDRITLPRPPAAATEDGRRYVSEGRGRDVRVDVVDRVCRDTMSGMPYPNRVTVTVDGEVLRGCGGTPESLLTGAAWVVEAIDGEGVIAGSRLTLDFHPDGRLTGRAGCNGYGAGWTLSGEGMTVEQPHSTLMSCAPGLDRQERHFLSQLAAANRFDIADDGALVIHTAAGGTITARRD